MRKITISHYSLPDKQSIITRQKMYCVWLQNSDRFLFSNDKETQKFLVETSRFLNTKLFQINDLYAEVFCIYRKMWFYLNHQDDSAIMRELGYVNKLLGNAHMNNSDNYSPFHFFYKTIGIYIFILDIIIEVHNSRNNWAEIHQLESLKSRITYIKSELTNYKHDHKAYTNTFPEAEGKGLSFKMKS